MFQKVLKIITMISLENKILSFIHMLMRMLVCAAKIERQTMDVTELTNFISTDNEIKALAFCSQVETRQ